MTPDELWGLHKTAVEGYRFNVTLGWERQKFFVGISLAITSGAATVVKLQGVQQTEWVAAAILACGFVASALGIFVVEQAHQYYRNARGVLSRLERELKIPDDLRFATTEGMRPPPPAAEPAPPRIKVIYAVETVLVLLDTLDAVGVIWLLSR